MGCAVACGICSLGENHVGLPGSPARGSLGAHAGTCMGSASIGLGRVECAGATGPGAHAGRDGAGVDGDTGAWLGVGEDGAEAAAAGGRSGCGAGAGIGLTGTGAGGAGRGAGMGGAGAGAGVMVGAVGSASGAAGSNESGQLGMAWAGVPGSSSTREAWPRPASSEGGGHAGIAGSVGGSGGQMSVSSGGAGAASAAGGHDFMASPAADVKGCVIGGSSATGSAAGGGSAGGGSAGAGGGSGGALASDSTVAEAAAGASAEGSGTSSPGEVGTVLAQPGVPSVLSPFGEGVCVFDQSGSPFCIGSAGRASSSPAEAAASSVLSAGSTGTVCAQTGVVSLVGTAGTGSSALAAGGVDSSASEGSVSKVASQSSYANTFLSASSGTGSGCCSAQSAASDASRSHSACTPAAPSAVIHRRSTSQAVKRTIGSWCAASSSSSLVRYFRWLSSEVCELMRQILASISVGPSPRRARATASRAALYEAGTSVPSTVTP